jgi:hypothetical protein
MLCVVCTVQEVTRSTGFLVELQNLGRWFVSGLASKPLSRVSRFGPQNRQLWFGDLGLKITETVSCLGLKIKPYIRGTTVVFVGI